MKLHADSSTLDQHSECFFVVSRLLCPAVHNCICLAFQTVTEDEDFEDETEEDFDDDVLVEDEDWIEEERQSGDGEVCPLILPKPR